MKLILTVITFFVFCSGTHAESVVDFIIANDPELQELRAINRNILKSLKVEAKSGLSYGQLAQEGTSTLDRAQIQDTMSEYRHPCPSSVLQKKLSGTLKRPRRKE